MTNEKIINALGQKCSNCDNSKVRYFTNYKGETRSKTYCIADDGAMVSKDFSCKSWVEIKEKLEVIK